MKKITAILLATLLIISVLPSVMAAGTESTVFSDPDFPVTFEIPAGWEEVDFNKPKQFLRLKLMRSDDPILCIMYGCTDLYSQIGEDQKRIRREELNMDYFKESEINAMLEAVAGSSDDYKIEKVGNYEYLALPVCTSFSMFGMDFQTVLWHYYTIEQGYMIDFQYSAEKDTEHFPEFIEMIESAEIG